MKFLLLGADGQVGHALQSSLANLGAVIAATRRGQLENGRPCETADLSDAHLLHDLIARTRPDWIVNAAAYTAVDKAEAEFETAWAINAQALKTIAEAAKTIDASVLHYSTDYVFDGLGKWPYPVNATPAPVNRYGESKLGGELFLRSADVNHIILRTQWVYAARGSNFLRTMLRLGAERDALSIVNDQRGTPTPARVIADLSAKALAHPDARAMRATHHLTCSGDCTWYEFAEAIFDRAVELGLVTNKPKLKPITSADYPTPAARPSYSVLDTSTFTSTFEIELPAWRLGLDAVMMELLALKQAKETP